MQRTNRNTNKLRVADGGFGFLIGRQGGERFFNQSLSAIAIAISKGELVSRLK